MKKGKGLSPRQQRVIQYMQKNPAGLTVLDGQKYLHTYELRKIVSDLRASGWQIGDEWELGFNSFGEETRFKRYFLLKGTNNA